ncbi:MAG: hypothetical protein OES13_00200 [Acidimicrobiia bacterium]|nr:hypothetical protein [Acidimicrobiia bacterium]
MRHDANCEYYDGKCACGHDDAFLVLLWVEMLDRTKRLPVPEWVKDSFAHLVRSDTKSPTVFDALAPRTIDKIDSKHDITQADLQL